MSSIPSIQPTTVSSRRIPTHHSTHRVARVARPAVVAVAATALVVPIAALAGPGASANPPTTSPNTPSTPAAGAAAGTAARPVVVATGLDNPRQLTFSPSGALYVAEAGVGGAAPCATGPEGKVCFGATGAIAQVLPGRTRRVVTGLPSLAGAGGMSATGPADLHVDRQGRYALLIGLGNNPAVRPTFGAAGARFGTILNGRFTGRQGTGGVPRLATDVSAHEARSNPDKAGIDSNPTGLVWTRWGYVVADAGANALVRVKHARTSTLAVFGPRMVLAPPFLGRPPGTKMPMESVPTSVAYGPDGALYVSELTGFPFPAGASTIWRVVPGKAPTVYATGLTNVTDLAWSGRRLYAVQLATAGLTAVPQGVLPTGSLVRVVPGGSAHHTVAANLDAPYGVAVRGRFAYVTTCAVCADRGQVVRVALS